MGGKENVRYIVKRETLHTPELEVYHTFGVQVLETQDGTEKAIAAVSDVSLDVEKITEFISLCNEHQLCPEHLLDVIEDCLNENKL